MYSKNFIFVYIYKIQVIINYFYMLLVRLTSSTHNSGFFISISWFKERRRRYVYHNVYLEQLNIYVFMYRYKTYSSYVFIEVYYIYESK